MMAFDLTEIFRRWSVPEAYWRQIQYRLQEEFGRYWRLHRPVVTTEAFLEIYRHLRWVNLHWELPELPQDELADLIHLDLPR